MLDTLLFIIVVVLGYLCGSVCSAVIVSKVFDLPDPRSEGSQNPGATNVLRLSGKKYALIVMLFDVLKGTIPVLFAQWIGASPAAVSFTAFAAVMGHMYPIFFGFKGGKGVATALGAFLGLKFLFGVAVAATWLFVFNFTRYSSMASMVSICLAPFYSFYALKTIETFPPIFLIMLFVLYQHRNNITRLMDGEEPKIDFRKLTNKDTETEEEQDTQTTAESAALSVEEQDKEEVEDSRPEEEKK